MRITEDIPQYEKVPSFRKARTSRRLTPGIVTCWTRGCVFIDRIVKVIGVDRKGRDITVTELFETIRGITRYQGRTSQKGNGIAHVHGRESND